MQANPTPDVYPQDPRFYLSSEYELRLKRRPHYSLRAFARDLGVSPSTLTDFLKGRLGFSRERAVMIARKINLSEPQQAHLWDLLESKFARQGEVRKSALDRIRARTQSDSFSLDAFRAIADWYHLAILELVEIGRIKGPQTATAAKEAAGALGLGLRTAKQALERLKTVGLLSSCKDGWQVTESDTFVGKQTPSMAIRLFHAQIMKKAQEALEEQSIDRRDFSSTIFSVRAADLPELKRELVEARLKILRKYASRDKRDSVYCLSTQLFDLVSDQKVAATFV